MILKIGTPRLLQQRHCDYCRYYIEVFCCSKWSTASSNTCVISKSNNNWYRHFSNSKDLWLSVLFVSVNLVCTLNSVVAFGDMWQYSAICGNILRYIANAILLASEKMSAILILHTLILQSGDNIEILPNPSSHKPMKV